MIEDLLLVAFGLTAMYYAVTHMKSMMGEPMRDGTPRGIRNNNPLNIIDTAGNIGNRGTNVDSVFREYATPEDGIAAAARLLRGYANNHGIHTVGGVVARWSATDQDTYAAYVASRVGVRVNDTINLNDPAVLARIIPAMIQVENGRQPYTANTINGGIARAFA